MCVCVRARTQSCTIDHPNQTETLPSSTYLYRPFKKSPLKKFVNKKFCWQQLDVNLKKRNVYCLFSFKYFLGFCFFFYTISYTLKIIKKFPVPLPSINSGSVWINLLVAEIDLWSCRYISWCTWCMRNHRGHATFLYQGLLVAVCSLYMVYFVLFFLQNFSHYLWFSWQKFLFVSWGLDFLSSYTNIHWALGQAPLGSDFTCHLLPFRTIKEVPHSLWQWVFVLGRGGGGF